MNIVDDAWKAMVYPAVADQSNMCSEGIGGHRRSAGTKVREVNP